MDNNNKKEIRKKLKLNRRVHRRGSRANVAAIRSIKRDGRGEREVVATGGATKPRAQTHKKKRSCSGVGISVNLKLKQELECSPTNEVQEHLRRQPAAGNTEASLSGNVNVASSRTSHRKVGPEEEMSTKLTASNGLQKKPTQKRERRLQPQDHDTVGGEGPPPTEPKPKRHIRLAKFVQETRKSPVVLDKIPPSPSSDDDDWTDVTSSVSSPGRTGRTDHHEKEQKKDAQDTIPIPSFRTPGPFDENPAAEANQENLERCNSNSSSSQSRIMNWGLFNHRGIVLDGEQFKAAACELDEQLSATQSFKFLRSLMPNIVQEEVDKTESFVHIVNRHEQDREQEQDGEQKKRSEKQQQQEEETNLSSSRSTKSIWGTRSKGISETDAQEDMALSLRSLRIYTEKHRS